jgi:spermidine synthase
VFETAWFHRAGLVLGSSVWSTTLVLSSFMGGLTVGAALVAYGWNTLGAVAGALGVESLLVPRRHRRTAGLTGSLVARRTR